MLDDLERALEAAAKHEEAKLEEGVQLVERELRHALDREGLVEIETGGNFDPHVHEALLTQPSENDEGTIVEVLQKGYQLGDRVLRPARVVISAGPTPSPGAPSRRHEEPLRHPRRPENALRRTRSRRRTASSPASTTRTRTRTTRQRRSASRRSRRPTTSSVTPRSARSTTPDPRVSSRRTAAPASTPARFRTFDLGDLFGGLFGGGSAPERSSARTATSRRP